MKGIVVALGAWGLVSMAAVPARAQGMTTVTPYQTPSFEVGVQAGFPTGFTGKVWLDERSAVDAGVAWGLGTGEFLMYGDFLAHTRSLTYEPEELSNIRLPLYVGIGPRLIRYPDGTVAVGPRVPVGIEAIFKQVPVSLFGEIAPAGEFGRTPIFTADAEVGARVWF